jgi:hypothetical protein
MKCVLGLMNIPEALLFPCNLFGTPLPPVGPIRHFLASDFRLVITRTLPPPQSFFLLHLSGKKGCIFHSSGVPKTVIFPLFVSLSGHSFVFDIYLI